MGDHKATPIGRRAVLAGGMGLGISFALRMGVARAEGLLEAPEALKRLRRDALLLLDVRSPGEWRQTGIPEGARPVTIHDPRGLPGFIDAVTAATGGDRERPIALICAAGVRSTLAQKALVGAGFTDVLNVKEGFFGSPNGPGWLKRGLPVAPCPAC